MKWARSVLPPLVVGVVALIVVVGPRRLDDRFSC